MTEVLAFPNKLRIGLIHKETGEFVGFSAPFSVPTRAAYVVFRDGRWIEFIG